MGFISAALISKPNLRYPSLPSSVFCKFGDNFDRDALTPTGGYTLYTEAVTGTGSGAMSENVRRALTTSATIGHDVDDRVTGFGVQFRDISYMEWNIVFAVPQATDTEFFVGLLAMDVGALTALPTTSRHIGVYVDTSVSANLILTSGNGAAQATTSTAAALNTALTYRLNIKITGPDTATVNLFSGGSTVAGWQTQTTAVGGTHSVTSFANGAIMATAPHWFIQTEAAATKALWMYPWTVEVS